MNIIKQISSLEKVRRDSTMDYAEIKSKTLLRGERFSYQIALATDATFTGRLEIDSEIKEYIKVFCIDNAVMDAPITQKEAMLEPDYITKEPGLMPDILIPFEERDYIWTGYVGAYALWIEVNIPHNITPGKYDISIRLRNLENMHTVFDREIMFEKNMELEVIDEEIMPQSLMYTRWFYADCIADYHRVPVYSEAHWNLIEKYIAEAADVGVNMILVPVHTPPLDTAIGTKRTCVQLVDIKKSGDTYSFSFDKFKRFVDICKKCGIKYFEIAHMFSQWGATSAPNIIVEENGVVDYMFGWHVAADSDEYQNFLRQYIAAIARELEAEGISENSYFHISDEPYIETMEGYKRARNIIKPLIGNAKCFDALSHVEFYENGLVECPVTSVAHIEPFLAHNIPNQWAYYCCGPQSVFTNSTLAMPSSRVRILGLLLYKYNIKGFLHWGLNYYNSRISLYPINPYSTTSADGCFPSGDPFILYPSKDGAYNSIRGKVIYEAIEDMKICSTLEKYIGRDAVVELIDSMAGEELKFDKYPVGGEYLQTLRNKMTEMIKNNI